MIWERLLQPRGTSGMRQCKRWLPVGLRWFPEPTLQWINVGSLALTEPMFFQSVAKLRAIHPPLEERETDLATLVGAAECLGAVIPRGLIFHVSRCGSTLITNAIGTASGVTVLSEPEPIVDLFMPYPAAVITRWRLLPCVVRVFGYGPGAYEQAVIIKFSSWNVLALSTVRALWPHVPCLILTRDPVEVMVSNLASFSGWMRFKADPHIAAALFGWESAEVEEMSPEEYCARGIGRFCESAAAAVDENCWVVDYGALDDAKIRDIAKFCGICHCGPNDGALERVLRVNSQCPVHLFEPDRVKKQGSATPSIRRAALEWADEPYGRLKECGY